MSEALTPEAPEVEAAVEAPAPAEAAIVGSVESPSVIPTERFNGLMSKYNADKSAWELERESMRTQLESLETQAVTENNDMSDEVLAEVRQLRQELQQEKLKGVRAAAVAKYPGSAPLADLIIGDTPEAIEAMASELHERLTALTTATGAAPAATETSTTAPAATAAPVSAPLAGGAVNVDDGATADENVHTALESGDFSAFLRAAAQRAEQSAGADLAVG